MDYIIQTEKLFKYLELNLKSQDMHTLTKIKKAYNNDLNLIGCFIKDFLTIENDGKISNDEDIYNDFVLLFEKNKDNETELKLISKLIRYSKYYLMIAFEDTKDRVLLNTIVSVNSCFNMEYYPFLMELIDKKINKIIDSISYALMLQFITDRVFKDFETFKANDVDLNTLRNKLDSIVKTQTIKRVAI